MKRIVISLCIFLASWACTTIPMFAQNTDTDHLLSFQDEITTTYLKQHLSVLAADSMEGRETGTRGQKMAAEYLAAQYRELGLKPIGDKQSYFQHYNLSATTRDSTVFETYRIENGERVRIERSVGNRNSTGSYIRSFGGSDSLSGEIVFAGFGVNDPTNNIAHLEGLDLRGKWVLMFHDLPKAVDGDTLINPAINGQSRFQTVMQEKGAEGMLLIPYESEIGYQEIAERTRTIYGTYSKMGLAYQNGSPGGFTKGYTIVSPEMATQILGLANNEEGLDELYTGLLENIDDFTPRPTGYYLSQIPYSSEKVVETENVVALLEGADPELKEEVVVLTSHYDHVGIGQPDSTGDHIYNGADDDGSGTVGMLNMAKAFVEAGNNNAAPGRSVLFLHVSGEEKGLFGSRYYSDHPLIPIEKTVANINIDMIGRVDPQYEEKGIENYSYIIGGKIISSQLDSLLRVANKRSANIELSDRYNDLSDPNQFYRRSDHWNFGRLGVPFIFFFTGVHEDYHRPSDEVHKIRFEKLANVVKTMYATTVMVANADEAPKVDNQEFIEITRQ